MSTKITLTPVSASTGLSVLNSNFTIIADYIDNLLSLDGDTPNSLGADLDLNSNDLLNGGAIACASLTVNGNVVPGSTITASDFDSESATDGYVLTADGAGNAAWEANAGGGGGLANVVEDLTPQLGGDLDANGNDYQCSGLLVARASRTALRANTDDDTIFSIVPGGASGTVAILELGSNSDMSGNASTLYFSSDTTEAVISTSAEGAGSATDLVIYTDDVEAIVVAAADQKTTFSGVGQFDLHALLQEVAAPSTPATGYGALYAKTDGKIYWKDDAGTETDLTAGAAGGISDVVDDTTPQLGGNLDVNGQSIVSVTNGDIVVEPNGTGAIELLGDTVDIGDPGTESGAVLVNGLSFPAAVKINRFGGTTAGELILHRHSTVDESHIVFSRAVSNDSTHGNVVDTTSLGDMVFTGWHTDSYYQGAFIRARVDGTPGTSDMPTKVELATSADGSATPTIALTLQPDQSALFAERLIIPELGSTPSTPATGLGSLYFKSDGKIYALNDAGSEVDLTSGGRELLTADRTYYVRTDGNDSNTGLVNDSGGAFLTIQKAIDTTASLDLDVYDIIIQANTGTYDAALVPMQCVGAGSVTIQGINASPTAVVIDYSASTGTATYDAVEVLTTTYILKDLRIQNTGSGGCINTAAPMILEWDNVDFGAATGSQISVTNQAVVRSTSDYTISGGATNHIGAFDGGFYRNQMSVAQTVTITGSPTFTNMFGISRGGHVLLVDTTYTGTVTTKEYTINTHGRLVSAGTVVIPGTAGTADAATFGLSA